MNVKKNKMLPSKITDGQGIFLAIIFSLNTSLVGIVSGLTGKHFTIEG